MNIKKIWILTSAGRILFNMKLSDEGNLNQVIDDRVKSDCYVDKNNSDYPVKYISLGDTFLVFMFVPEYNLAFAGWGDSSLPEKQLIAVLRVLKSMLVVNFTDLFQDESTFFDFLSNSAMVMSSLIHGWLEILDAKWASLQKS